MAAPARGDILYRGASAWLRLPKGASGTVLTMGSDDPAWSTPSSGGFNWTTDNEVTTDQSPATSDLGERYLYTSSTAATKTVTLPSVGASEDGKWIAITNASKYMIYVTASDTDYIGWPMLKVLSIEMLPSSHILLRYDHSRTRWDLVLKTGEGQVRPTGTVLYLRNTRIADGNVREVTRRHIVTATGTVIGAGNVNAIGLSLDGTDDFCSAPDSADWDFFGATTGAAYVGGWVYCDDAAGTEEIFVTQYEGANDFWYFRRDSDGSARINKNTGGSADVNINGGSVAQNTWTHVAVVRVGAATGLYVNGVQVAYDATFSADTYAGSLYFGQSGASNKYFDGRMDDWAIVYHNIFGAAPNVGVTDTFAATLDTLNPLGLVI